MKKITILALGLFLTASFVEAAPRRTHTHRNAPPPLERMVVLEIINEYGRPLLKHGGWADNLSAEILSPEKGPLFTPRTWTDKKGRTAYLRVVTVLSPNEIRFADYQDKTFDIDIGQLSIADQEYISTSYKKYIHAQQEHARIRSRVAATHFAANPPPPSPPQRKPKGDTIEDRLEDMEAAAAAARMRQQQMESRQHHIELERRFEKYR